MTDRKGKGMSVSGKKTAGGIVAGALGILLLIVVLFSSFYLAAEAGHDCVGEDCPVCVCIHLCENTLNQIGSGTAVLIAVAISLFAILISATCFAGPCILKTLVSGKVRLNI